MFGGSYNIISCFWNLVFIEKVLNLLSFFVDALEGSFMVRVLVRNNRSLLVWMFITVIACIRKSHPFHLVLLVDFPEEF